MYHGMLPTPDRGFVARLTEFDPQLVCAFSRRHSRFVIFHPKAYGSPDEVLMVGGRNGHFRQPDNRELRILFGGDLHRVSPAKRQLRAEDYMRAYREDEDKKAASEIRDVTKDDKIQLMRAYTEAFNMGKNNATFRRIEHKPRGYKVVDKRKFGLADNNPPMDITDQAA